MAINNIGASVWDIPGNIELLTSLYAEGKSASEIARSLGQGVSRNAVIGKAVRLKLPRRGPQIAAKRNTGKGRPPGLLKKHPGGAAFAIARARKRAEAGEAFETVGAALFGQGIQGGERVVEKVRAVVDDIPVIPLLALSEHTCRWPVGDPGAPGFGFCGVEPMEGKRYCSIHSARAFNRA